MLSNAIVFNIHVQHAKAGSTWIVDDDGGLGVYTTIQAAINALTTMPGDTILVKEGTYFEHINVNKKISLIGENHSTVIIDGNNEGIVVSVNADDVLIKGFTIRNGEIGIRAISRVNLSIMENNITDHKTPSLLTSGYGIYTRFSSGISIQRNIIVDNEEGVLLSDYSQNFILNENEIFQNKLGISTNSSSYGLIVKNKVYENSLYGIYIPFSTNCVAFGNTLVENANGISVEEGSSNILIYHNNFVDNFYQGYDNETSSWDNGIEGNYWSNYLGNDTNYDGIGETPYSIQSRLARKDYRPLMGPFSSFNISEEDSVSVVSNSTILDFNFFSSNTTMRMHVTDSKVNQTHGFCRVCIPYGVMSPPFNATVNGTDPIIWNYSLSDDGQSRWIYFLYPHHANEVIIRGSAPPDIKPPKIIILSPENKTYPTNSVSLTFNVSEPISWIGYSRDGLANATISGNYSLPPLDDRTHSIVVYANDTVGNMGKSSKVYFAIDTTPPNVMVLSPINKTYASSNVALNFKTDEVTSWSWYSLDGQANETLSGNKTLPGLAEGTHRIVVYANDTFGHIGNSEAVYFKVDTVAPTVQVFLPENKTYTSSSITLNFTVSETVSWISYSLDGQTNMTISGNTNLTGLSDGAHKIRLYAEDGAGNIGASALVYFSVNTQPQEAFPTWMMAIVGTVGVVIAISLGAYFIKARKAK